MILMKENLFSYNIGLRIVFYLMFEEYSVTMSIVKLAIIKILIYRKRYSPWNEVILAICM